MHKISKFMIPLVFVVFSGNAWSLIIDGNDVGDVDTIIAVTSKTDLSAQCGSGNSPAVEECWVDSILDPINVDYTGDKPGDVVVTYDMGTIGIFELVGNPEYYIVKNSQGFALVQNVDEYGWGVVDSTDPLLAGLQINFGPGHTTVSHVTHFGEITPPVAVPEPASTALMGIGLLAFAGSAIRRRRKH